MPHPDETGTDTSPVAVIGAGRRPIPIAQVRRTIPVGTRVQVFYLKGQREQTTPDVRTVTKQTSYEMITGSDALPRGSHLGWAGCKAERDTNDIVIIRDAEGTPFVAYKPLNDTDPAPTVATLPIDPALQLHYAEARRTTDPARLADIARSEIAMNRRTVAENPHTPAATLNQLSMDEDVKVRRAVAGNTTTPPPVLDRLAGDPDLAPSIGETKVAWLVANNPNTTSATLAQLATNSDTMVRSAVGRHPNTSPATLEQLATPPPERAWIDSDVRQAIAGNPNTPSHILAGWEKSDGFTMPKVAGNPSTPSAVLERMSHDTQTGNSTRAQAATNPSLPLPALKRLALEDPDAWVREHAAKNPNIGRVGAHRVAGDFEPRVRRALARNEHVDSAVLAQLQTDPNPLVRAALVKNPSITPSTLHALLNDANPRVRAAVSLHDPANSAGAAFEVVHAIDIDVVSGQRLAAQQGAPAPAGSPGNGKSAPAR